MNPRLTIIMSTYNDVNYISKALNSILNQNLEDWELIIINDASKDETQEQIFKILKNDKRLTYIVNKKRKGVTTNIRNCIDLSKTEYIARLDADDYWLDKNKLKEQYKLIKSQPDLGIVGTWAKVVDKNERTIYHIENRHNNQFMKRMLLYENPFVTSSILFRKIPSQDLYCLNTINQTSDDYNLVLRTGIKKKFFIINKHYTAYRVNPIGISQSKSKQQISDTISLIKYYKKYYPNYSKAYILWNIRKYYPSWLRGKNSLIIKNLLSGNFNENISISKR